MTKEGPQRDLTEPRFRPNTIWVCGHSDLGFACALGPTSNGKCGNHHQTCAHEPAASGASACSSCELACHKRLNVEGAQAPWRECETVGWAPCVPVRSAWSFRNQLALNLALATAGILLCLMVFPQREAAFVPGSLSSKHAQILDNRVVSERCSLCHPNSHTLAKASGEIATQDELCARCHEGHLPKLHERSPHDLDRAELKQLTLTALASRGLLVSFRQLAVDNGSQSAGPYDNPTHVNEPVVAPQLQALLASSELKTECASCHVEHHGRKSDLQAISDTRCQACHAKQFTSFGNGHPEFSNYPAAQPRRIAFTHKAHLEKHFSKKNETFDCSQCHVDSHRRGGVGSVFRTLGFEATCARCHNESINASAIDGWVLLQLPSVKPEDVQQSGLGLSDWPATAQFGYEGSIPLVMRALLTADTSLDKAIKRLPESGDIASIPDFDKLGRDTTISLAVGARALIGDIAANGQVAWKKRLESVLTTALARELAPRELKLVDELCAGLPPDVFRQMQQNWFGGGVGGIAENPATVPQARWPVAQMASVQDDDRLLRSTESDEDLLLGNASVPAAPLVRPKLTKLRGAIHVVQGGWYLDNETLSLRYMPRGHSDATLAAWSEFATLLAGAKVGSSEDSVPPAAFSKQVPGGCTQCHVLSIADAGLSLTDSPWTAISKPATARSITQFDHTPHLTLPTVSDCKYCHQLASSQAETYALDLYCEFKSLHLEQCSACHRPNAASTSCTHCHNYHVTVPALANPLSAGTGH